MPRKPALALFLSLSFLTACTESDTASAGTVAAVDAAPNAPVELRGNTLNELLTTAHAHIVALEQANLPLMDPSLPANLKTSLSWLTGQTGWQQRIVLRQVLGRWFLKRNGSCNPSRPASHATRQGRTHLSYLIKTIGGNDYVQAIFDAMPPSFETSSDEVKLYVSAQELTAGQIRKHFISIHTAAIAYFGEQLDRKDIQKHRTVFQAALLDPSNPIHQSLAAWSYRQTTSNFRRGVLAPLAKQAVDPNTHPLAKQHLTQAVVITAYNASGQYEYTPSDAYIAQVERALRATIANNPDGPVAYARRMALEHIKDSPELLADNACPQLYDYSFRYDF